MRFWWIAVLVVGCGREPSAPPPSDTLWALAPDGARGGIVISPRGVAMIENGYAMVRSTLDTVGDFALVRDELAELTAPFGGPSLTLADFGFSPTKGAALFLTKDGMVAVLPVVDRDKFLAKAHGTKGDVDTIDTVACKQLGSSY